MKHTLLFTAFMFLFFQCALAQNYILDNTFGTTGEIINPAIQSGQYIQLQSDGKIMGCYLSNYSTAGNVHLARFNVDGSIDTSFGTNGYLSTNVVNETGGHSMMKIQSDGKILVTGSKFNSSISKYLFMTNRYNTDGSIDTSFGINGSAITNIGASTNDFSFGIDIQTDGKILVVGYSSFAGNDDTSIVRYLSTGQLDTSFAVNGVFTYNFGTCSIPNHGIYSNDLGEDVKVNSVGKIIVGVTTDVNESVAHNGEHGFFCLNSDGTLDTSFGNNGQKVVDYGGISSLEVLKLTADDKIIATGEHDYWVGTNQFANIAIVKLLSNGNYDTSFGTNGIVITNYSATSLGEVIHDLCIQPDGKIICLGNAADASGLFADFLLVRFNTDGTIDTTFNSVGYLKVNFNNTSSIGNSLLIQNDGKLLCSGEFITSSSSSVCMARLEIDNLSTTNFDSNNNITISPNPFKDSITISTKDINLSLATIELYDISGRKISNFTTENTNNFTFSINSNLSKGNYFLKITDQQTTQTFKLIKE